MKLISCHIDAFGKLKNVDVSFNENITSICEKNGYGKTTLASFIKAMFYGLGANARKNSKLTDRTKYQPFDGGKFGGELVFECQKGKFKIRRVFNRTQTTDEFALYDAESNLVSNAFSQNIGRELFGVGKETFDATVFFGQKELPSEINDDIKASLSTGKLYGDDVDALSKAIERIKQKIRDLKSELKTVNLDGDKARLRELTMKESALTDKMALAKNNLAEYEQKLSELKRIKNDMDLKQKGYEKLQAEKSAKEFYLNDTLKNIEKNKLQENALKDDVSFAEENIAERKGKSKKILLSLSLVMFLVTVVMAVCIFAIDRLIFSILTAVFFVGFAILLFFALKQKMQKNALKNAKNVKKSEFFDKNHLKSDINVKNSNVDEVESDGGLVYQNQNVEGNLNEENYLKVREIRAEITEIENEITNLFGGSIEKFVARYEDVANKINSIERLRVERQNDLKHYQNEIESLPLSECNDRLETDKERVEELEQKIGILEKTGTFLMSSSQNLSKRYVEPVQQKFNEVYKRFVVDDEIIVDANLDVHLGRNMAEEGYLSAGLQDLVAICKRFALIDLLFENEKPFVILDDPFVNLDDKNLSLARELVKEVSKRYQVIFLTCHSSRKI